jgi:serine/threonine protein kinase
MPLGDTPFQARLVAGRYRLLGELGRGGMGAVWQAEDVLMSRQVAVKELRLPPGLPDDEREVHARRALARRAVPPRVRHPGTVTLYDVLPASADDGAAVLHWPIGVHDRAR